MTKVTGTVKNERINEKRPSIYMLNQQVWLANIIE